MGKFKETMTKIALAGGFLYAVGLAVTFTKGVVTGYRNAREAYEKTKTEQVDEISDDWGEIEIIDERNDTVSGINEPKNFKTGFCD